MPPLKNNTLDQNPAQKRRGFGLIGIIIMVAIVVSFGVGGGLYWNESQKQKSLLQVGTDLEKKALDLKDKIEAQQKNVAQELGGGDVKTSDTSTWKTYQSEKYRFEVKIPNNWEIQEGENKIQFKSGGSVVIALDISSDTPPAPAFCDVNPSNTRCEKLPITNGEVIIDWGWGNGAAYVKKGGTRYFFTLVSSEATAKNSFRVVLSTFKFTELIDISSWKTYRNEEYGFEFKYPSTYKLLEENELVLNLAPSPVYGGIDLSKISPTSTTIYLYPEHCSKRQCDMFVTIQGYTTEKPNELDCYEGICDTINLVDEKKKIEDNGNFTVDGYKVLKEGEYFPPGDAYSFRFTMILPKYKLKVGGWYDVGGKYDYRTQQSGNVESILKSNFDENTKFDFETFLEILETITTSIDTKS